MKVFPFSGIVFVGLLLTRMNLLKLRRKSSVVIHCNSSTCTARVQLHAYIIKYPFCSGFPFPWYKIGRPESTSTVWKGIHPSFGWLPCGGAGNWLVWNLLHRGMLDILFTMGTKREFVLLPSPVLLSGATIAIELAPPICHWWCF